MSEELSYKDFNSYVEIKFEMILKMLEFNIMGAYMAEFKILGA